MQPYIYLQPTVVEGVGEISGAIIQDAATIAEYHLEVGGGLYAMADIPELDRLIAMNVWRSPAAMDVKLRIQRKAAIELSTPKAVEVSSNKSLTSVPQLV